MAEHIQVDDGNFIHLSMVKRLRHVTDKERQSLGELENVKDAEKFSLRIDHATGKTSYIPETIDEVADQGVALVQISEDTFVPRDNILQSKAITPKDRDSFMHNTGRQMPPEFQSQIETKAGKVLSPLDCAAVMKRIGAPYQAQTARPGEETAMPLELETAGSLKTQRESVLADAAPKANSNGREHPRER